MQGKHSQGGKMMKYMACFIFTFISMIAYGQQPVNQSKTWFVDIVFKLETNVEETNFEIEKLKEKIQSCDVTISKSERIIGLAQQSGNAVAEGMARSALQKSTEAKQKNVTSLIAINAYLIKLKATLESIKSSPADAELKLERFEFENRKDEWIKAKDEAILKRLEVNNPDCENLQKSLKAKAPPLPLVKTFANLQMGDVLLIDRGSDSKTDLLNSFDKLSSYAINAGDQIASKSMNSKASHALIYLKEINGKKMFLDNVPGKGPRIISEDEYLFLYGNRGANVAQLAQPIKKEQYDKLYDVARKLADDQAKMNDEKLNKYGIIIGSKFGIAGSDMVCSESSRWVLMQIEAYIPETDDHLKKDVHVEFSPADFVKGNCFIVTPLQDVPKVKAYKN